MVGPGRRVSSGGKPHGVPCGPDFLPCVHSCDSPKVERDVNCLHWKRGRKHVLVPPVRHASACFSRFGRSTARGVHRPRRSHCRPAHGGNRCLRLSAGHARLRGSRDGRGDGAGRAAGPIRPAYRARWHGADNGRPGKHEYLRPDPGLRSRRGRIAGRRRRSELRRQPRPLSVLLAAIVHTGHRRAGQWHGRRLRPVRGRQPAIAFHPQCERHPQHGERESHSRGPYRPGHVLPQRWRHRLRRGRQPVPVHRRRHEPVPVGRLLAAGRAHRPVPGVRRAEVRGQHQRPAG